MNRKLLSAMVVGLVAGMGAVFALASRDPGKADRGKLQGIWKVVAAENVGGPFPKELMEKMRFTFSGDSLGFEPKSDHLADTTFRVDAAQNPKTIDLTSPNKKRTSLGIYEWEGDNLKLCFRAPDKGRPSAFAARSDEFAVYFELTRSDP